MGSTSELAAEQFENQRADLEQQYRTAASDADRDKLLADGKVVLQQLQREADESQANFDANLIVVDIDVLAGVLDKLHRPFTDPAGYCSCYAAKLARLTILDASISAASTSVDQAQKAATAAAQYVNVMFALWATACAAAVGGALAWGVAWAVAKFATVATWIGWALVVLALIAAIAALAILVRAYLAVQTLLAARQKLLELALEYYRLERVSTCLA